MPRLRNTATGVVVNVSDDKAKTLDGYEPADAEPKKAAARRSGSGSST